MRTRHLLRTTSCAALATVAGACWNDSAQAQGAPALEEITVTARRVEESLMQVPIAVSALTADAIEQRGAKSIIELAEYTPGLFAQVGGNGRVDRSTRRLTFRGLSTVPGAGAGSSAVFIDGAPYAGNGAPDVTDVERVEVLKGPQSVYFGRSTFSGAVNYVTKEPNLDTFGGRVTLDAYSYKGFDGSVSLTGPIVREKLGVRVNARRYTFGGQYRNGGNTTDRMGKQSTTGFSASVIATPSDQFTVNAFYSFTEDDDGVPPALALKVAGPAPILNCNLGGTGGPWWCGPLPDIDAFDPRVISVYANLDAFTRRELLDNVRRYPVPFDPYFIDHFGIKRHVHNAHLRLNYEMESGWGVNAIAAYDYTKYATIVDQEYRDASNIPNPFYPATPAALAAACAAPAGTPANQPCFTQPFHQLTLLQQSLTYDYSLEARLYSPQDARLRGTLGASLFSALQPGGSNFGFQAAGRLTQASTKNTIKTPAIFGGVYFDVTDELTINAEGRYQWDRIGQQQLFPIFTQQLKDTFKSFAPRVTIDYTLPDESLLYATWARGFRQGGFNSSIIGLAPSILAQLSTLGTNLTFKQEKLDNFEVGHKGTWLDNRLRTTIALYYMQWRDGQVSNTQFFTRPDGSTGSATVVENRGKVNLKGVEIEADVAITEQLTVAATLDYQSTTVKDYVFSPDGLRIRNSTNVNGNRLEQAPDWTWTISPSYTDTLVGDWEWFARIDYRHRGKVFFDATNVGWIKARDLVNARIGVSDSRFRLEFYVNNLFNDKKLTEAVRGNDVVYGPSTTCPPCFTAALPPTTRGGSLLNELRVGLPVKRTFGVKANYEF
jgi:iron complex outermembrane receptor protein